MSPRLDRDGSAHWPAVPAGGDTGPLGQPSPGCRGMLTAAIAAAILVIAAAMAMFGVRGCM